jgi:DtxR family Mn-dependent transcriptional regulator
MTESEEMYLVTIARLKETCGEGPIPLSTLATDLNVLPVSANQMIRKLEENGWVIYQPYKGVELSQSGQLLALQTLRRRRLWEVFLVERLAYSAAEAGVLACRLEHALPAEAAERLAKFLGNPISSPLGDLIPQGGSEPAEIQDVPLTQVKASQKGTITRIEADSSTRAFLMSQGLLTGTQVEILATSSSGEVLLCTASGKNLHLSETLAKTIRIH